MLAKPNIGWRRQKVLKVVPGHPQNKVTAFAGATASSALATAAVKKTTPSNAGPKVLIGKLPEHIGHRPILFR
jgi:hypothetical protein